MKKTLLVAVAALAVAVPAIAGDCDSGFSCSNHCPLAQQANTLRSTGREGIGLSAALRAVQAAQVERSLARV